VKKILLILSITFLSTQLFAEGFNDNYIQLGYSTNDYKFIDKITTISGSAEFGNNYSILGSYTYEEGDWNDPGEYEKLKVDLYSFGIGKAFELNSNTDITSSLMYVDYDTKQTCTKDSGVDCTSSYSDGGTSTSNYYTASIGIRNLSKSGLEMSFKYTIWRAGKLKPKSNETELALMKNLTENYAIGGSVLSHKKEADWTEYGIFVRRNF
jgi:hypothetical protein